MFKVTQRVKKNITENFYYLNMHPSKKFAPPVFSKHTCCLMEENSNGSTLIFFGGFTGEVCTNSVYICKLPILDGITKLSKEERIVDWKRSKKQKKKKNIVFFYLFFYFFLFFILFYFLKIFN